MSFMSVFRYYKGIIRQPRRKADLHYYHRHYPSYFHQHVSNMSAKHRKGISYGHFLLHGSEDDDDNDDDDEQDSAQSEVLPQLQKLVYDPYYINDDLRPSQQTNTLPQVFVSLQTKSVNCYKHKMLNRVLVRASREQHLL